MKRRPKTTTRILLLDLNNLVAKMTHAYRGILGASGMPVGGIFGTVQFLRNFLVQHEHDMIVMAVDRGVPAFRTRVLPSYKRKRKEDRDKDPDKAAFFEEYRLQMEYVDRVLRPLGVHFASASGYEADDIIGACTLRRFKGFPRTILSEDKDLIQLTGNGCRQFRPCKKEFVSEKPMCYVLRRAIWGDPSDGIVGVRGIGEVWSGRIVENVGAEDLDEFFEALDPDEKHEAAVRENEETVRDNFRVMDLRRTARKANKKMHLEQSIYDRDSFQEVCREFHFRKFLESPNYYCAPFERASQFEEGRVD